MEIQASQRTTVPNLLARQLNYLEKHYPQIKIEALLQLARLQSMDRGKLPHRGPEQHNVEQLGPWADANGGQGNDWHSIWNRKSENDGSSGGFVAIPILFNQAFRPGAESMPSLIPFLQDMGNCCFVHLCALTCLAPGQTLHPHTDPGGCRNGFVTLNMLINNVEGATLSLGRDDREWIAPVMTNGGLYLPVTREEVEYKHVPGQYYVYDAQRMHWAKNMGLEDRLVLTMVFQLFDPESPFRTQLTPISGDPDE